MTKEPFVKPGFEPIAEAFDALLTTPGELGSALCVYLDGAPVVDIWGGPADPRGRRFWQGDTVVSLFSAGKALLALCLLHLVDRGQVSLHDPIVDHWPEFATVDGAAKSQMTLDHLLHHRAGLPVAVANRPGDVFHWDRMIAALEHSPLVMPAGTQTAYHAITFGHLIGEVIRRVSGLMPSVYFDRYFAAPLGLELSLKLSPDQSARLASCDGYDLCTRFNIWRFARFPTPANGWQGRYYGPCDHDYHPNSKRWQVAEAPAVTAFGNARGLAQIYAMLSAAGWADGQQILSQDCTTFLAQQKPNSEIDIGTGQQVRIGSGFYFSGGLLANFGPGQDSFGHVGMGGTTAFADPKLGLGFGYVCNHLYQPNSGDKTIIGTRAAKLATVLYDLLHAAP